MPKPLDRILCTTDLSDASKSVVHYSIDMAKKLNAKLYICHVIDLPTISVYGEAVFDPIAHQQYFVDFAGKEIENLVAGAGGENVDWEPLISIGHATEEIVRHVSENAIELVVAATHGRSGLKRFFLGSVTERLIKIVPCPLLVLRAKAKKPQDVQLEFPFRNILVAYDFSKDSESAFSTSLSFARQFKSNLHIVHVVEPTAYKDFLKSPEASEEPLPKNIYDALKDRLIETVPPEAIHCCEVQTRILVGKPYAELIAYAEQHKIDLIALGVRGQGRVEELLVGSTTDRVIRRASCAVLSVLPVSSKQI